MLDTTQPLPFTKGYFDVIFSVGAYNMFGDTEEMLPSFIPYGRLYSVRFHQNPKLPHEFAKHADRNRHTPFNQLYMLKLLYLMSGIMPFVVIGCFSREI
jgi:hypothetical protein